MHLLHLCQKSSHPNYRIKDGEGRRPEPLYRRQDNGIDRTRTACTVRDAYYVETMPAVFEELLESVGSGGADLVLSDMAPNITGIRASDQARAMALAELAQDAVQQFQLQADERGVNLGAAEIADAANFARAFEPLNGGDCLERHQRPTVRVDV